MKKLLLTLAVVSAAALTGCNMTPQPDITPVKTDRHTFSLNGVANSYDKAVECVYDVVDVSATSGSLFDTESEEKQRYSVTYVVADYTGDYGSLKDKHTMFVQIDGEELSVKFNRSYKATGLSDESHSAWRFQAELDKNRVSASTLAQCINEA